MMEGIAQATDNSIARLTPRYQLQGRHRCEEYCQ